MICRVVLSNSRVFFRSINCINPYTSIERTESTQHQEQFFLKPFQIENQIANTFDIECTVSACSKTRNAFDGYCLPSNECKDRYTPLGLDTSLYDPSPNDAATQRRRRRSPLDVKSTVSELTHFKSRVMTFLLLVDECQCYRAPPMHVCFR